MKIARYPFYLTKICSAIALSILSFACNGQENKGTPQSVDAESTSMQGKATDRVNATLHGTSGFDNEISQVVRMVFQDSKGDLWFGAQMGAFRLSGDSLIYIDGIKSETGKGVTIKDVSESPDGKIWFGHTDGISSLERGEVINYYKSDGLIDNDVWSIETDAKGDVWIGTIAGACRFDGNTFTNFELPKGQIDSTLGVSSAEMVHSIFEDSKGDIWFSTNAGLFKYTDGELVNCSEQVGIQTNFVNEIVEDSKGTYWISTKQALYRLRGNELEEITRDFADVGKGIGSIAEDKDGKIWFVFNQHYLYTYDGEKLHEFVKSEENKGPVVYQIFKDQSGRLWFVGFGGAYRLENGTFVNITKNGPW